MGGCNSCGGGVQGQKKISLMRTVKEGIKAAPRVLRQAAARQFVPKEEFEKRMETCRGCDFFVKETARCTQCTCFLNTKNRLSLEECPEGFWGRYEYEESKK